MKTTTIDEQRLLGRIRELGVIGLDAQGRRTRLAADDNDRLGRDAFAGWARSAGLDVLVDRIGNMFAIWGSLTEGGPKPLLIGSHIDSVIDAGALDGCFGVLAGLEAIESLKAMGINPPFPVAVAAFTNEEGVRYAPDMMGSAVFAGSVSADAALASIGTDGTRLGDELARIGYAGSVEPGFFKPRAYVEIHIEQGPVLEREGMDIGIVEGVQGISWKRVTINGQANHAGTTPMSLRTDAGVAAARIVTFLDDLARKETDALVATVGTLSLLPSAINVVPGRAILTIDMRSSSSDLLLAAEEQLEAFLAELHKRSSCRVEVESLARTEPVAFDSDLLDLVEDEAISSGQKTRRMTSGAGHDAQMIAPIAPTAMLFVPSRGGISHNPLEDTEENQLVAGANLLTAVVKRLLRGSS